MHAELSTLDPHAPRDTADICIIGAGVAGLVLASRLSARGRRVLLLEAGGIELEPASQLAFAEAEMAGDRHTGTHEGRFRAVGGSSTRWGGQLLPFTADVFTQASAAANSNTLHEGAAAWPLHEADLATYYSDVLRTMHAGTLPWDERLLAVLKRPPAGLGDALRVRWSKWTPFSHRNLARTLGRACLADDRVDVITHANVVELAGAAEDAGQGDGRIVAAVAQDDAGRLHTLRAHTFVIAAGTVESSRLLLLSERAVTNAHDQFGRYFHDHLSFHAAELPPEVRAPYLARLGPFVHEGVLLTPKLEATAATERQHGLLAVMAHLVIEEPEGSGIAAVRQLLTAVQRGELRAAVRRHAPAAMRGAGDIARLLWATRVQGRRAVSRGARVYLNIDTEQAPDASNRVRLSETLDAYGVRRAVVDWRVNQAERSSLIGFAPVLRESLLAAGLPAPLWAGGLFDGELPPVVDTYHAMGGLRMGTDPRRSVVDRDLRVHGCANLRVASCAVYPRGGSSNPTFTLMALAMRLADQLAAG